MMKLFALFAYGAVIAVATFLLAARVPALLECLGALAFGWHAMAIGLWMARQP
jgi:hypothetical protein